MVVAFSSRARIFGRMFDNSLTACVCLFFCLFVFLKWRLACAHYFHSLGQDQSTVAQRAEMTDRVLPDELCVSFHTMPGQRHIQPTPTSLSHGCMHV